MYTFYLLWAILAVIVAAAFALELLSKRGDKPKQSHLATLDAETQKQKQPKKPKKQHGEKSKDHHKPKKQDQKHKSSSVPKKVVETKESKAEEEALKEDENSKDLFRLAEISNMPSKVAPTATTAVVEEAVASNAPKVVRPTVDTVKLKELQQQVIELAKDILKATRGRERLKIKNRDAKDAIARQEKINSILEQGHKDKLARLEQELVAVQTGKDVATISKRDALGQRNYVKNHEQVLQQRLETANTFVVNLKEDLKLKQEMIAKLEKDLALARAGGNEVEFEKERTRVEALEERQKELTARLLLQQHNQESVALSQQSQALKAQLDQANQKLQTLTTQHQATKATTTKAKQELSQQAASATVTDELTAQVDEAEKRNKTLQGKAASQAKGLHQKSESLQTTLADLDAAEETLNNRFAQLENELAQLDA